MEERTVYLRSRSAMTIAHEFGHAPDCALGGGVYRSGIDPELRRLYADARAFATPYAAARLASIQTATIVAGLCVGLG